MNRLFKKKMLKNNLNKIEQQQMVGVKYLMHLKFS